MHIYIYIYMYISIYGCAGTFPIDLAVGSLLVRGLDLFGVPVALSASIFHCSLQYLVTPSILKNTQKLSFDRTLYIS